jgi:saccharopine dehydrogenase (NAD+, L-lysine forming)
MAPPASFGDFVRDSASFNCTFRKFTSKADIFISAHFWDGRSGRFFTEEDVKRDDFRIRVIADITCDIKGSVPTTLRASTIAEPIMAMVGSQAWRPTRSQMKASR